MLSLPISGAAAARLGSELRPSRCARRHRKHGRRAVDPLGELSDRLKELDRDRLTIVHCHSGMRSAQAVRLLREAGFENVFNLEGGIAKWSDEIDSDVPKY